MPALETLPRPVSGIVVRKDRDNQFLLYNSHTDELHLLKPLAHEIFALCDGTKSVSEILAHLTAERPVLETPEGRTGVLRVLEHLSAKKLISLDA